MAEKIQDGEFKTSSIEKEKKDTDLVKLDSFDDFLLNESFVRNFFEAHISKLNLSDFSILKYETHLLKSKRRKPAIEFKLHLQSKTNNQQKQQLSKSIIGKRRSDSYGEQVFSLLQELWNKGFDGRRGGNGGHDHDDHLKICEPIAYFPDYNLMLTSKASGLELGKVMMMKGDGDNKNLLETYVKQAAAWLAKLHSIHLNSGRTFSLKEEEKKLNEWGQHLSSFYPYFAEKIKDIFLPCILETEKSIDTKLFVPIHGDFNPNNIFVDGTSITVIDFEQSCIFDPTFDLGYFIAKLISAKRRYNLFSMDTDALQKCFLDKYAAERSTEQLLERVNLYKARSYLQHLHFRYWTGRRRHKPDPVDCEYWLNKAEECLKGWM